MDITSKIIKNKYTDILQNKVVSNKGEKNMFTFHWTYLYL